MAVKNKMPSCKKAQIKSVHSEELNFVDCSTVSAKGILMNTNIDVMAKSDDNNNVKLSLSEGTTVKNNIVSDYSPTWKDFKTRLSTPEVGNKDGALYLRGRCNGSRSNDNMESAPILIIDGDKSINPDTGEITEGAPSVALTQEVLKAMGYESCIYTSYSHCDPDKGDRWRISTLLDRSVSAEETIVCTNYFYEQMKVIGLNVAYSQESVTFSQPWYFPRCPEERISNFYFAEILGQPLNVQEALDWNAEQPQIAELKTTPTTDSANIDDSTIYGWFNKNNPIEKVLSDNGYEYENSSSSGDEVINRYSSPHSTSGSAGIIHFTETNKVYSHNQSDPLANGHAHDAFSIAVTLNYDGDATEMLDELKPAFDTHIKQKEIDELVNLSEKILSGVPEDKKQSMIDISQNSEMEYQFKRKKLAKDIGIGVGVLDSFRKGYVKIQEQIQSLQSDGIDEAPSNLTGMAIDLISKDAQFFHDKEDVAYATIEINGHTENYKIASSKFKSYIRNICYKKLKTSIDDKILKNIAGGLTAKAQFDGDTREVYLRVAKHAEKYYIDICNDKWQVIEVDKNGYRVLNKSPVAFIRTSTMTALPTPVAGEIKNLWDIVHIENEEDRLRWLTGLIDAYRPDTVYPLMNHTGGEGSGKTNVLKTGRSLVDPSTLMTRGAPKNVEDCQVAAANNHVLGFENMSTLSDSMSDTFCRIATGSGYATRLFYTNGEEAVFSFKRPIIMEGIPFILTKPDIIDRTIHFDIPQLNTHLSESQLVIDRKNALPGIFGAILELFSNALSVLDSVKISADVRMIDYAKLGQAIYHVSGYSGDFSIDLYEHQKTLRIRALEASPAIIALIEWIESQDINYWEGTPSQLLEKIRWHTVMISSKSTFPKSGKGMADLLKRHTKVLKSQGIEIIDLNMRSSKGNLYKISW